MRKSPVRLHFNRLVQLFLPLIDMGKGKLHSRDSVYDRGEGFHFQRHFKFRVGLFKSTPSIQKATIPSMGINIVGIERKAASKVFFGGGPIQIKQALIKTQQSVSFAKLVV